MSEVGITSSFITNNVENLKFSNSIGETKRKERLKIENEVNLNFNGLKSVPSEVLQMNHLRVLILSNNNLEEIPSNIKNLKNLLHLDLSNNMLKDLPQALSNIHLRYLNLSHNKFSVVPCIFFQSLQFLRVLDLSHNYIKQLYEPLSCIINLIELNISYNKLKKVPKWIFHVKCNIEKLNISHNELTEIDRDCLCGNILMEMMSNLKVLNLENCKLRCCGLNFLSNVISLETLNLSNNDALDSDGPSAENFNFEMFEKYINLKNLYICNVGLSFLPKNFGRMKCIQYLDLEGNFLTWLPDNFCDLITLKICRLSANNISFLPTEFGKLVNLKELYVNSNDLVDLPDSFQSLVNLEYCDLYSNKLIHINPGVINLKSLKGIDLEYNYLDFEALCNDKEIFNDFILKYSAMKEHYRKKTNAERSDWQIPVDKETKSDYEQYESDSENDSYLASKDEIIAEPYVECTENWDEEVLPPSVTEHDYFDPNVDYDSELKRARNWRSMFNGNFCPGDNHIPSVRRYFCRKTEFKADEGQFELN